MPGLDGIRGLAVLMVVVFHAAYEAQILFHDGSGVHPLDRWWAYVTRSGWAGVDLFFVLSGFLITGILYDSKARSGYFRNFFARRVLRIVPLYYAYLVLLFVLLPILPWISARPALVHQVWYWLYLPTAFGRAIGHTVPADFCAGATGHLWSLALEEQFYLIWPAVVLLTRRRGLMLICGFMVGVAFLTRLGIRGAGVDAAWAYWLLPARMDALAIGALFALAARSRRDLAIALSAAPFVLAIAAMAVTYLFVTRRGLPPTEFGVQTAGYTALAALFGALVLTVAAEASTPLSRLFNFAFLRLLGKYSYGMYIIHIPLLVVTEWQARRLGGFASLGGVQLPVTMLFVAAILAGTFALACLTWHGYEQRFLRLKGRFAPKGNAIPDAVRLASQGADVSLGGTADSVAEPQRRLEPAA